MQKISLTTKSPRPLCIPNMYLAAILEPGYARIIDELCCISVAMGFVPDPFPVRWNDLWPKL